MNTQKRIDELKNLIKDPGHADRSGRTVLDRRADKVRVAQDEERNQEIEIVKKLSDFLSDFHSPEISSVTSYIKQAGLPAKVIANEYLKVYRSDANKLNMFQMIELCKFLINSIPDQITIDDINVKLYGLKESDPWLYASLLSKKYPHKGLDFVKFLINNNWIKLNSLLHLLAYWFEHADQYFLKRIENELEPLIKDKDTSRLIKYNLNQYYPKHGRSDELDSIRNRNKLSTPVMVLACSEEYKSFKKKVKDQKQHEQTGELEYA